MVDLTADVGLSAVESGLCGDVQALLREMNRPAASQNAILRWKLEKKVEADPSCSISLISELVKELEERIKMKGSGKVHECYLHIIPMLHTLYYLVIQSGSMIPTSLYQRAYKCLTRLLILPLPYSAVALSTLRSIEMEMTTPGSLYQRRVTAEQNLKNKHFTSQEMVLVLADPAVFSAPLEASVRAHLEASSSFRDTPTVEKNLMIHVLQVGLGTGCQSSRLAWALEALGDQAIEKYFEEVVLAMEQGIQHGAGGYEAYMNRLQDIHRDILTAAKDVFSEITEKDGGSAHGTAVPFPEIKFLLWTNEEDLWNLLANFTLCTCSDCGVDEEEKDKRDSVRSEDSGIERDLKESDFDDTEQPEDSNPAPAFTRRNAFKKTPEDKLSLMREKIEAFPGSSADLKGDRRPLTARVVVMGDDRVLGRLAKAYQSIRDRESKRLILTNKLNLQLYYIPVTDAGPSVSSPDKDNGRLSLAFLLGKMDPWYNSNINCLGAMISKPAGKHSKHSGPPEQNLFLLDTLCYYLRCGMQPVHLPLYSVKMTRSSSDGMTVVEDMFVSRLQADVPEFKHLKGMFSVEPSARGKKTVGVFGAVITVSYTKTSLSKREVVKGEAPMTCGVVITSELAAVTTGENYLAVAFDSVKPGHNTKIQTQNISIRTVEHRTLSVCLDDDSRRTYTDVQRIEISPCLDPGCSVLNELLSKYLNKVLSLPINTFTGVTR